MRQVRVASIQPQDQFHIWSNTSPGRARAEELRPREPFFEERRWWAEHGHGEWR